MKPVYSLFVILLFSSCGRVQYVGQSYEPTNNVAVYVTPHSVKRSYDVIGMGFINSVMAKLPEKMQKKAVSKAKNVGADAVLIEYYSDVLEHSNTSTTQIQIDTVGRFPQGRITTQSQPIRESGFRISYLKYK